LKTLLPIDEHLPRIAGLVRSHRALVVVAPPGAGKTSRVPPALLERGPLCLLQPRRVAARSLARRIADEQGWTVGEEVGWQVRFERQFGPRTRLLVATEGILTARFLADPLLSDFATVVLDEFHERSLHGDLALAFAAEARRARDELAVVVMSATLDPGPVASFLGGCPVVEVRGREHPVELRYAAGQPLAVAVRECLATAGEHLLCFLPGAPEIGRLQGELGPLSTAAVLPLHGRLDAPAQDAALAPSPRRKVILATNLAETSLTIEGVTDVIDSGLHKIMRYDAERGIDRLELERIPADAAAQRAGRAGRVGPGRALRLWDQRDRLRPRREPEIARVDLAAPALEVLAWGADPRTFPWFEPPPEDRLVRALDLLGRLGAAENGRITALGRTLRRFPLHPRLARVLLEAGGSRRAAAACALLSEARLVAIDGRTTDSDVLTGVDRFRDAPAPTREVALQIETMARSILDGGYRREDDEGIRRALLAGYPDRVAERRGPLSSRLLLSSGAGAVLARESGVRSAFLVAHDVARVAGAGSEALVRTATAVEREWLRPTHRERIHRLCEETGSVEAIERSMYGAIVLEERPVEPEPAETERLLLEAVEQRGLGRDNQRLERRLRFAGLQVDLRALLVPALAGQTRLGDVDLSPLLPEAARRQLERLAPEVLGVPSGRAVTVDYRDDGSALISVKLQELFGLGESPRLGPRSAPVLIELLAPNGRPVQTTRDLRSFWDRTYPLVRKELRGRYPRHPWPEDPWTAPPTARPKGRKA
jgi:ATP-dependent helicase HrpB